MDFFTVPTITFSSLYCFFVISHDRRRILHFNITKHPTSSWIMQQLREAFPFGSAPRFVIFDRDAKYGLEVPAAVCSLRMNPLRTSFESPWQNGVAERWVGSCRRDAAYGAAFGERSVGTIPETCPRKFPEYHKANGCPLLRYLTVSDRPRLYYGSPKLRPQPQTQSCHRCASCVHLSRPLRRR